MVCTTNPSFAQCERAKLAAAPGQPGEDFGRSVAISGNVTVVGEPTEEDYAGAAYVFRFDGTRWIQETRLVASDGVPGDRFELGDLFGSSVSISGNVALIGAHSHDTANEFNRGAAYVFRYDGVDWVEEAKLVASDGHWGDVFGKSVSIDRDVAIIGARNDEINGALAGSAYIFRYNGSEWAQEAKLIASDIDHHDLFGGAVSISGDLAVIGAWGNNDAGMNSGAAYVFRYKGREWPEETKLTAFDASPDDRYGRAVSISGDARVVVVGSYQDDADIDFQTGSAYVYHYDNNEWAFRTKLAASDPVGPFPFFGRSVSIASDGNVIIIGAPSDGALGAESGAAYVFGYDGTDWEISPSY